VVCAPGGAAWVTRVGLQVWGPMLIPAGHGIKIAWVKRKRHELHYASSSACQISRDSPQGVMRLEKGVVRCE
jgi:hypothetical protein